MNAFATSLAELISDSALQEFCLFLLSSIPGFPPIIQTVHILGIAVVMASIVMLDLRILGLALGRHDMGDLTRRVMPWLWWAVLANTLSGAVFVFARPGRYFDNPIFGWKLGFLLAALLLTLIFYMLGRRKNDFWTSSAGHLWGARLIALLSLGLWIMVMLAGRWIAYREHFQYPMWTTEIFDAGPQESFLGAVENWPLSQVIAATNWFPLLESIHVIAITMVVGSILWVDLRLLGLAVQGHPVSSLSRELLRWTWSAFALATVTGLGMFITRAASHMVNPAFRWKLFLLLLAGVNMAVFHFGIYRRVGEWDLARKAPVQARLAAAGSLLIWSGVMLAGRWVGHIV